MIMDDSMRAVRRALIIFLAAVLVSVLAALTTIGSAALTRSLAWSVIGGLLVAALVAWILGFLILRRGRKAQRLVIGPLVVLGCAAVISLTWLYPGAGGVMITAAPIPLRALSGWTCRTDPGWRSMSPGRQQRLSRRSSSSTADRAWPTWRTTLPP
jgi:ABC-type branched-subunit amino acid transport system permease subunit